MSAISILACLVHVSATHVYAQRLEPSTSRQMRVGGVTVTPLVAVQDIGFDTNVYNQADEPIRDFGFTVTPVIRGTRTGRRAAFTFESVTDLVYFARQTSERSVNADLRLGAEFPLRRVKPFAQVRYWNTRERVTFEIDSRARRAERSGDVGLELTLTPKLSGLVRGRLWQMRFDHEAVFDNVELAQQLDRETRSVSAEVRYRVTPLTSIVAAVENSDTEFRQAAFRNSDVRQVTAGVEFQPRAIVSGSAHVGYQQFLSREDGVPDFAGLVTTGNLTFTIARLNTVTTSFQRSVSFSYFADQPIYVQTEFGLSVGRQLSREWGLNVSVVPTWHSYRRLGTGQPALGREDLIVGSGAFVTYDVGPRTRMAIGLAHYRRRSDFSEQSYDGFRLGSSIAYGF